MIGRGPSPVVGPAAVGTKPILEPLHTCKLTTVDGVPGGFAQLSFSGRAKRLRGNCQVFSPLAAVIWSEAEMR